MPPHWARITQGKIRQTHAAQTAREEVQMVPPRKDRFGDFTERLDRAKGRHDDAPDAQARGSAMGTAFRITSELVVGLIFGGLLGWQLDKWLDTSPVLLIMFFVLGAAAGIWNVIRVALQMQSSAMDAQSAQETAQKDNSGSDPDGK
jgi:ATP synthase protein I